MAKEISETLILRISQLSDVLYTISWLKTQGIPQGIVTKKQVETLEKNIKECMKIFSELSRDLEKRGL